MEPQGPESQSPADRSAAHGSPLIKQQEAEERQRIYAFTWPDAWTAMVAEVRGALGTLIYPHLIRPYSVYYGHIATQYGGPSCSPISCWCNTRQLLVPAPPIYEKVLGLKVFNVLNMGSLHTKPHSYDFFKLYGACLQAPTTPKFGY